MGGGSCILPRFQNKFYSHSRHILGRVRSQGPIQRLRRPWRRNPTREQLLCARRMAIEGVVQSVARKHRHTVQADTGIDAARDGIRIARRGIAISRDGVRLDAPAERS